MNRQDAEAVLTLLHHLDGSREATEETLVADLLTLHASAAAAFRGGALPLDDEALLWTLSEVAQRHADAGYWNDEPDDDMVPAMDGRAIEDVQVGDRL